MARITDKSKIERLKKSTMKLVVEKGYGGASAILIAKDAKVASGYFYMHYKGKYELVNALLHDVYQEIFSWFQKYTEAEESFERILEGLLHNFLDLANKEPVKVKFLYVLTNDYSIEIDRNISEQSNKIIDRLKEIGLKSGELDERITADDLFLFLYKNTIQYINQRFIAAGRKRVKLTKEDEEHLLYLLKKVLIK